MDIRIDMETETVEIGGVRWAWTALLGHLEAIGELRSGDRLEVTREDNRALIRKVVATGA